MAGGVGPRKNASPDSGMNQGANAVKQVEWEVQIQPAENLGGTNPPLSPWDYGLGLDLTHDGVSGENPMVWPQDDGNVG